MLERIEVISDGSSDEDEFEYLAATPHTPDDPLGDYLRAIGRTPLLNALEEVELAKRIEAGVYAGYLLDVEDQVLTIASIEELEWLRQDGEEARQHFMRANLRLVVSAAKRFQSGRRHLQLLDLIQEGNVGLDRAVKKFDYKRGYKFSTYGMRWIKQSIGRSIDDQDSVIRKPVHYGEFVRKIGRVRSAMTNDLEREPTLAEIAQKMETSEQKIVDALEKVVEPTSLNRKIGDNHDREFGDLLMANDEQDPEAQIVGSSGYNFLHEVMSVVLSSRECYVIQRRYGLDGNKTQTLDEIGKHYGVTRERIRQIEREAVGKLRIQMRQQGLKIEYFI